MKKLLAALLVALAASAAYARVDINSATAAELEALKDIGPVKAKAIVEYRKKHGAFKSLDELDKVPGIGTQTLQKVKGELAVLDAAKTASGPDKKPTATSPVATPNAKSPAPAATHK